MSFDQGPGSELGLKANPGLGLKSNPNLVPIQVDTRLRFWINNFWPRRQATKPSEKRHKSATWLWTSVIETLNSVTIVFFTPELVLWLRNRNPQRGQYLLSTGQVVSGIAKKCVKRLSYQLISLRGGLSVGTGPLSQLGFSVHLIDLNGSGEMKQFLANK